MSKRKRFIITTLILVLGFIGIQIIGNQYRFVSIAVLGLLTIITFIWSLKEGLGFNMSLLSLILPFLFTIGVGLFWFLLPSSLLARIPVLVFYGVGIYSLCLTANIYTVGTIRTIALLRAAKGVGFVLTLVTLFLLYDTILSLRIAIFLVSPLILLTSLILFFQGYWSVNLKSSFSLNILKISLVSSLVMGEISLILFFWPTTVAVGSLFFTISSYVLLGLGQARLEDRLFTQTIREYFSIAILVSLGMFLATRWGG